MPKTSLADPTVIITTFQPLVVLWICTICFFVSLALIAVVSRGRAWHEIACMFLLSFLVTLMLGFAATTLVLDRPVLDFEVITYKVLVP